MSNQSDLSPSATAALLAFEAMRESKQEYFNLLQRMDEKYRNWGQPSEAEKKQLDDLLEIHNQRVEAFSQAMTRVEDPQDREALIQRMN
ncbi:MAG: hypothetical protein R3318_05850 [Gammaproteobacteria bacterium]|nr:hypothetical protein [Gammaproteobacteria bacterium]